MMQLFVFLINENTEHDILCMLNIQFLSVFLY